MIIALIPARGGSKRVPRKNLRTIGNYSLVEWSIIEATNPDNCIDHVFVSTDDPEIKAQATAMGVTTVERSEQAAGDDATDRDVVMDFFDKVYGDPSTISLIVYLRPTTPIRPHGAVKEAIDRMMAVPAATGLRSVHEMGESAFKCFTMGYEGRLFAIDNEFESSVDDANLPNHKYEKTYQANGVVDIIRPAIVWLKPGATFGDDVIGFETKRVIEIDNPDDLAMCRMKMAYDRSMPAEVWRGC